ncbi:hypothetical protein L484_009325 [Morus notabilis]|uniref:Uncharacterized protein n=1 Tax=Morus notabilis TaxID=981085 RepID=W9R0L9_9ROSA|nr:hypothetical protein L484_009325 [Morus notabilis]
MEGSRLFRGGPKTIPRKQEKKIPSHAKSPTHPSTITTTTGPLSDVATLTMKLSIVMIYIDNLAEK